MTQSDDQLMRIACGDGMGYIKVVGNAKPNAYDQMTVMQRWGDANKPHAPTRMTLLPGRADGSAQLLDLRTGTQLRSLADPHPSNGPVVGACSTGTDSYLCAYANGTVVVHDDQEQRSWRVAQRLTCAASNADGSHLAVGGDAKEPALWNVATQQCLVAFKAGKPTRAGNMLLPCTTALTWLADGCVVTGNAKHRLLLYDQRVGRRPQLEQEWGGAKVTAVDACAQGQGCWAANGVGVVQRWDLAANSMGDGLRGAEGAVKAIAQHPQRRLVVTAGLDHRLRVFDGRTRSLLGSVYAKQPLQCVVVLPDVQAEGSKEEGKRAAEELAEEAPEGAQETKNKGAKRGRRA